MTVLIYLTTAGAGTGPFSLYSNVDGYVTPFETGVPKISLTTLPGYTTALVPNGTTTIRVQSTGACTNYIDIVIGATTTTTTTSGALTTTTTSSPTTTTTTTLTPVDCGTFSLEGGISGRTFNFTDCDGIPQEVVLGPGAAASYCILLPYSATGATYINPCGEVTLSYTYLGGGDGTNGVFTYNLTSPLPSTITITGGQIAGYSDGSCSSLDGSATQASAATITAGNTVGGASATSQYCAPGFRYIRNSLGIIVNGNPVVDGDTLIIGGVTLNISIPNTCQLMGCVL
jgi:hypothetical protein